jgi:hypothetical protein
MPLGSVIIVSVSSGFDEGFVFACGGNFDGAGSQLRQPANNYYHSAIQY